MANPRITAEPFAPDDGTFPPALDALLAGPVTGWPILPLIASRAALASRWAGRAAVALARRWSAHGQTVYLSDGVVNSESALPLPEVEGADGLADVVFFGASLGYVSHPVFQEPFRLIPRGVVPPDAESMLAHPRWAQLAGELRDSSATLVLLLADDTPGALALAARVGRVLVLASADEGSRIADALPASCSVLAALEPVPEGYGAQSGAAGLIASELVEPRAPEPRAPDQAGAAPSGDEEELAVVVTSAAPMEAVAPAPGQRRRAEDGVPGERETRTTARRQWLWPAALVALLMLAWVGFELWQRSDGSRLAASSTPSATLPGAPATAPPGASTAAASLPLPYSVVVAAYKDVGTAETRLGDLRGAEPQIDFFLAPILVDSVLYYRILAGAAPDSSAAAELMRRLVRAGHKSAEDGWSIRQTRYSFHLGDFQTLPAAEQRAREVEQLGVPAYVVEVVPAEGRAGYRLYAGAYEGPAEAVVMAQLLRSAGLSAPLVHRTGLPAT